MKLYSIFDYISIDYITINQSTYSPDFTKYLIKILSLFILFKYGFDTEISLSVQNVKISHNNTSYINHKF